MENETDRKLDENSRGIGPDRELAALKREHAYYVARGETERAKEVEVELAKLTGRKEPDAEPVERAVAKAPETRAPRKATARKSTTK